MIALYILGAALGIFLLYVLFLVICGLFVDPKRSYETDSRFYRGLLNGNTAAILKLLRVHVHVSGLDKLPGDDTVLFVGNHVSNYDPIVTWHALGKRKIAFISKPSNFKIPFFGPIIRRCCFMAIDRENPRNAILTINRAAELLKKGELSVGVYPEGTRSKTGQLLPFHNGVFKIAQKAKTAVAVVAVTGTDRIRKNIPFRKSDVYVDVLEVLPAQEICAMKTEQIGQQVRQLLTEQRKKDSNDLYSVQS